MIVNDDWFRMVKLVNCLIHLVRLLILGKTIMDPYWCESMEGGEGLEQCPRSNRRVLNCTLRPLGRKSGGGSQAL